MSQRTTSLRHVQHATLHWRNQWGQVVATKPRTPTVYCRPIGELLPECQARATEQRDCWTPVVRLFLSLTRVIKYEGKRAQQIWKQFNAGVYGKKKGKVC